MLTDSGQECKGELHSTRFQKDNKKRLIPNLQKEGKSASL
jgi:hypothetical protein